MDNGASSYRRFLDGDKTAFEEIVTEYRENLTYFIERYVHDPVSAEDIAADTFAYLIVYPKKYDFRYSFKTYLYTVARSRALDWIRKEKHYSDSLCIDEIDLCEESGISPEEYVINDELKQKVTSAVNKLQDDFKTAIYLVYYERMSYDETAKIMKKSRKQIDNILYRAKKELKKHLESEADLL